MKLSFKSIAWTLVLVLALAIPLSAAVAQSVFPEVIPLFDGYQPEGITAGYGTTFYTGSLNGGAIFRGDVRTGEVEMIAEAGQRMAVGNYFDPRSGFLFVAGGGTGAAYVFDGETGELLETYQLTTETAFINDVIVTREAAYFTNSFQKEIYALPLGPGGSLPDPADVQTIPLGDGFTFNAGAFNANGIESSRDGSTLIIVNSSAAQLFTVDPETGEAMQIDLGGGAVPNGDGLVLRGHTLYVVQNRLNKVAVVDLSPDFSRGEITDYLCSPNFRVPTTAMIFGDALYLVNARFDEIPGGQASPTDDFEAVRLPFKQVCP